MRAFYTSFSILPPSSRQTKDKYRWVGFGKKPIWVFRAIGAAGSIICGFLLLQIILVEIKLTQKDEVVERARHAECALRYTRVILPSCDKLTE